MVRMTTILKAKWETIAFCFFKDSVSCVKHLPVATQVYCVNWNVVRRNTFLTGSWDDSIKLWDLNSPASLATFKEHTYCVYAATW